MNLNLLLVENEESQAKLLRDAVDLYNDAGETTIVLDEANNLEDGLYKLRNKNYDGAIVDLRLEQNDTEGKGNKILKEIRDKLRFPVRVISGHLGDLNPELKIENYLFKCINRGDEDYEVLLSEFNDIHSTGITAILNNKGLFEKSINDTFWKHISEILSDLVSYKKDHEDWDIEKVLLRYILLHMLEYLELDIDSNFETAHPIECYIKPPIKNKIFTGDIVKFKNDGSFGVILTPACDLATDGHRPKPKAEFVTIARIYTYEDITRDRKSGDIKQLERNSLDLKYHFLPETKLFEGGFINFQHLQSISIVDIMDESKFEVECVITHPFRKDIISRFANYFSRQGQPSFS